MTIPEFQGYISAALGFARPTRYRFEVNFGHLTNNSFTASDDLYYSSDGNGNNVFRRLHIQNLRNADRLAFLCQSAQFPGKGFEVATLRHAGPRYQVPEASWYYPVTATFYMGEDMMEKKFFDAWQSCVENPVTWDFNFFDEYATDIKIYQFSDLSPIPNIPGLNQVQNAINTGLSQASMLNGLGTGVLSPLGGLSNISGIFGTTSSIATGSLGTLLNNSNNPVVQFLNNIFGCSYYCTLHKAFPIAVNSMPLGYGMLDQVHLLQVTFAYQYWNNPKTLAKLNQQPSVSSSVIFPSDSSTAINPGNVNTVTPPILP